MCSPMTRASIPLIRATTSFSDNDTGRSTCRRPNARICWVRFAARSAARRISTISGLDRPISPMSSSTRSQ